jgi:Secretion system C-terminal sorting domain
MNLRHFSLKCLFSVIGTIPTFPTIWSLSCRFLGFIADNLFFFLLSVVFTPKSIAQVTKVKYVLEFDKADSTYAVYIKITEGYATKPQHRAQFNAQICIVTPSKSTIELGQMHMPLQANHSYAGKNPLRWTLGSTIIAPKISPKQSFYSITPQLMPTAFYNDLKTEDEVKLFSFKVFPLPDNIDEVRLYDNGSDPKSSDDGMKGTDFRNGFTMGSVANDYDGNLPSRIAQSLTSTMDISDNIHLYPNPVINTVTIDTKMEIKNYNLIDSKGNVMVTGKSKQVDCSTLSAGIYYLDVYTAHGMAKKKVLKI